MHILIIVLFLITVRPLQTTITTMDNFLLAERRYDIECITVGSRPPAVITWWKNSRQINQLPTIVSNLLKLDYVFVKLTEISMILINHAIKSNTCNTIITCYHFTTFVPLLSRTSLLLLLRFNFLLLNDTIPFYYISASK